MSTRTIVLDASALVDLLLGMPHGRWVAEQIGDCAVAAPGHLLAEALNAVGKVVRRGSYPARAAAGVVGDLARLPVETTPVGSLLAGAWARRDDHALSDALYVELAAQLDTVVITTDHRLARSTPLAFAPPDRAR